MKDKGNIVNIQNTRKLNFTLQTHKEFVLE